ncbi:hypothetical protein EW026_g3539 [Hermanssonia centrifuga]|uniref:DUF3074 domain-containing protein n=1 Tax=Hermanssonia centrifuga TaxID=98765 RepID=A0A4S4KJU7_9APHY|nr:hypothetical protein EW026_g3539 [Hermanssonia centrifuga]
MASEYKLNVTPVKVSELPTAETLLVQGRTIIESTNDWKQGKTFYKVVKTYSAPKAPGEPAGWYCRVSEHTPEDATFDEFWEKLGVNKGENEVHYVDVVKKATLVKQISPSQAIWSMYYRFPAPLSPRVFTVLQTIELNESTPRTGIIVSIPVDLSSDPELAKLEEKGVKARYVSIESLKELDGGKVEWRMATASRAEGNLPQFLTERSMPSSISHDVPGLLKWLHSLRPKGEASTEPGTAAAEAHATTVTTK